MEHRIITISRQYGSGARLIGARLAEKLEIPFYDKEIIAYAAKESDVSSDFLVQAERGGGSLFRDFFIGASPELTMGDKAYLAQFSAIRMLAEKGPCVMVGRGAGAALDGIVPLLNVFIYADLEQRKRRAVEEYGDAPSKIESCIVAIDKKRASYFKFYTGLDGREMTNYNICVDSGFTGIDGAVTMIETAYLSKNSEPS
ncbi:MAG: cytidylate kinase-like family protein [Clostridia bacterium]